METYCGHVRSPADAIKLFEACRLGLLPRVQRRLSEKERQSIKSGSVFVWDEREAGMRRWTDGKSWSASRVSGSFLTYREMEGKRGGGNFVPTPSRQRVAGKTPDSGRGSDEDADMDGEGPDGYRYKPDGLMKQSFSITTSSGQHLHLISYYARPQAHTQELLQPTTDPALRHIVPVKGMYPESTVHEQGPPVTRAPMQNAYMNSPQPLMAPGPPPPRGPYPYQAPQGYSWPPSPVSTPPYNYPGPYGSQLPPPPPGSGHPSPHQYPHHHTPGPQLAPQQAPYDRAPPPLQDPSLPHPSQSNYRMSGPPKQMPMPPYQSHPSPRVAQARLVAEQQAQQAQRISQQQQPPLAAMIDPRITSSPRQQQMSYPPTSAPQQSSAAPTSAPAKSEIPNGNVNSTPTTSQPLSQNIPSISSLVNNTSAEDARSAGGASSRTGSASPKGNGEVGGPQDIPHTKLGGFVGEDMRVTRMLDRKFCI